MAPRACAASAGLCKDATEGDIMVQQGLVTITGYAGNNPVEFGREGGPTACTFRLGCTRGYYDANRVWRSHPTTWISVKAFRRLADNVLNSIRKGDPVIVVGQLGTETWTQNGEERSRIVIDATSVGHDLNGGVANLRKMQKEEVRPTQSSDPAERQTAGQPLGQMAAGQPIAGQPGVHVDAGQTGVGHGGAGQVDVNQTGACRTGVGQVGAGAVQVGADQAGAGQVPVNRPTGGDRPVVGMADGMADGMTDGVTGIAGEGRGTDGAGDPVPGPAGDPEEEFAGPEF